MASGRNSAYREHFQASLSTVEQGEINGADPVLIAHLVERIINDPRPGFRHTAGPLGQRLGISLKKILPYNLFELLMMRYFGLK